MIENVNPEDPVVLESLESMINDIPWAELKDYIKEQRPLRREFERGGFRFESKHKDRAVDTIIDDCKGNDDKYKSLFLLWVLSKDKYKGIYLGFKPYLDPGKEEMNEKEENIILNELFALLPEEPAKYFLYFSSIDFSEEQSKRLLDLSVENSPEKVELLRETIFEKNKEIVKLRSEKAEFENLADEKSQEKNDIETQKKCIQKLRKENNDLGSELKRAKNKEKQLEEKIDNDEKRIKEIEQRLEPLKNTIKSQAKEIEVLEDQNQQLSVKEKELEKLKEEGLKDFLDTKTGEINSQLSEIQAQMEQKKSELGNILSRMEEEKQHLESLEEFNRQKRNELMAYVEKGEKWKRALYPTVPGNEIQSVKSAQLTFVGFDEQKEIIKDFSELELLLEGANVSNDEMVRFRQTRNQLSGKRLFQVGDMKEISQIENFFRHLGHENGCFVLNADVSWLTPASLWENKGYLKGYKAPVTLKEVIQFSEQKQDMIFHVEILGANRAPLEGYLGPLIKAIERNEKIPIKDDIMEIPRNLFFFLQFDNDEYCAKPSNWLKEMLNSIKVIPMDLHSKNIFVPTDILFKEIN